MNPKKLASFIEDTITREVEINDLVTRYRRPLIGYLRADDPRFEELPVLTAIDHMLPADLLPSARSVVSFFLPFAEEVVHANTLDPQRAAREWAVAYVETNTLIGQITSQLIDSLTRLEVQAAAVPATGNADDSVLRSRWSHKSIAVLAGIGSFGLHQLVITDAGCAGRLGSLVIDAALPVVIPEPVERCEYYLSGTCLDCLLACPVNAIDEDKPFDRQACWMQCVNNSQEFLDLGEDVKMCGKCAVFGHCALGSAIS